MLENRGRGIGSESVDGGTRAVSGSRWKTALTRQMLSQPGIRSFKDDARSRLVAAETENGLLGPLQEVEMNMGSKGKKRMVLPTRPDPPAVEQIIEDINRAEPSDPVFRFSQNSNEDLKGGSHSSEVEAQYMQSRRYLELNERLQEARTDLMHRREELRMVGESLEQSVAEVKGKAL